MMKWSLIAAYVATVPLANWLIGHVGVQFDPIGPHLLEVWPGLYAPSGVIVVGVALVLRDVVQHRAGVAAALSAIVIGTALSFAFAAPGLVLASGLAFLLSEAADLAVYTPLAKRRMWAAVIASGVVGAAVDSAVFLLVAFGSLSLIEGQVVGKLYASAAFAGWLFLGVLWRRASREAA